jgi:hypothetical protein
MIAVCRLRYCARTQAYAARRTKEGKTKREIIRCLKRYIAREAYHALQADLADSARSSHRHAPSPAAPASSADTTDGSPLDTTGTSQPGSPVRSRTGRADARKDVKESPHERVNVGATWDASFSPGT